MADSSALSLIGLLVSLITKCWNFWKSLFNFFLTDGIMYMSGKAYKPTDPGTVEVLIKELLPLLGARRDWTFVDLGCGQGGMLTAMRNGAAGPMFERVIGVELDEDTHRQAVKKVNDPSIEVVCGDMFAYVKKACAQQKLLSGRAVFYMYEPLWAANMPKKVRDEVRAPLTDPSPAASGPSSCDPTLVLSARLTQPLPASLFRRTVVRWAPWRGGRSRRLDGRLYHRRGADA